MDRIEAIRSSFSSGTNLVPFIYTDPIDVLSLTTSNANLVTVPVLPENLSKFFYTRYYWNLNPITSNTECFVQYRSGAEWNIQLQKSKKHIISVYLKHNSATNVSVTLRLNTESGQVLEGIVSVIPRILIGLLSYYFYQFLSHTLKNQKVTYFLTGIFGTFVNTFFVLSFAYILYAKDLVEKLSLPGGAGTFLVGIATANGIPEMLVSALITVSVVTAVKKINK